MKDTDNLINALNRIKTLETVDQQKAHLKYLKKEILNLEIAVVLIGLLGLSLIVLPIVGLIQFNFLVLLGIVMSIVLIFKAFRDGESFETEKFFLLLIMSKEKENQ
jgi:hypothetical protein